MQTRQRFVRWMTGLTLALVAALAVTSATMAAQGPPPGRGNRGQSGAAGGVNAYATGDLDTEEQEALTEFLYDEHRALATYEAVMATFGEVQPFATIARAEEQHVAVLERVFARYDLALPAIPAFDVPAFDTVEDACEAGAQAEIDNAALYDRLLATLDNPDVVQVAENLRGASLNSHMPAFEACATGEYDGAPTGQDAPGWRSNDANPGMGMRGRGGSATGIPNGQTSGSGRNLDCPAYQQGTFRGR